MARSPDAPSRLEILVLSSLARAPMHGYELKLELQYKHVAWWAKCEHGHLYAVLLRLERRGFIRRARIEPSEDRRRRIYKVTPKGIRRVESALKAIGSSSDSTYFDVDLFLSGAFLFEKKDALAILDQRCTILQSQLEAATRLRGEMGEYVPAVGRLIMEHRIDHLMREIAFATSARSTLAAEERWGPYLGNERITTFLSRTRAPIEAASKRRATRTLADG